MTSSAMLADGRWERRSCSCGRILHQTFGTFPLFICQPQPMNVKGAGKENGRKKRQPLREKVVLKNLWGAVLTNLSTCSAYRRLGSRWFPEIGKRLLFELWRNTHRQYCNCLIKIHDSWLNASRILTSSTYPLPQPSVHFPLLAPNPSSTKSCFQSHVGQSEAL